MNASNHTVCVLRSVNGHFHLVAAAGRTDLVNNETTTIGSFITFEERTGPSGSHVVICQQPIGRTYKSTLDINEFNAPVVRGIMKSCVIRLIGKHSEFVDANGRKDLVEGEALISGRAVPSQVKSGPSGSHIVKVWNFVGKMDHGVVPSAPSAAIDTDSTFLFVPAGMLFTGNTTTGRHAQA